MDSNSEKQIGWLQEYRWFFLVQGCLAAGIFYADLSIELGVATGVPYICLVLVSLWARQKRYVWIAAALGSILTIIGFWLSPPGGEIGKVLANRFLALLAIWVTAILCYLFKKNEAALEEANAILKEQFATLKLKDVELELTNRELEGNIAQRTHQLLLTNLNLEKEIEKNLEAHKELETTHYQLSTILETAGVGIYGLDLQGRTTFCNPSGATMVGYEIDEMIGKMQHDMIHHTQPNGKPYPIEQCQIYAAIRLGANYRIRDEVFWKKDGSSFPVEYISSPVFEGQKIVGAVVTFKDISVQKHIEEEREGLLSNLEHVNAELRSFAHMVSHDLKEPLRGISYNAKWLLDDFGGKLGDEGKKLVSLLTHNTQRMHNLITGILEYAEVGKANINPPLLRSSIVAEGVVKYLKPEPGIEISIQDSMPEVVYQNYHLEQIFQNLISNGMRHLGKPEGKIVVSCADQNEAWCFNVWDNGKGIESKHFDRIFEMFQSLDRKNSPESTGIGLTLVKKIVEQNGGRVWVESEVGKFTCFKFTVPKNVL